MDRLPDARAGLSEPLPGGWRGGGGGGALGDGEGPDERVEHVRLLEAVEREQVVAQRGTNGRRRHALPLQYVRCSGGRRRPGRERSRALKKRICALLDGVPVSGGSVR